MYKQFTFAENMKRFTIIACISFTLLSSGILAQGHSLVKKWETGPEFKIPESVLFDAKEKILYVSNMDGDPAKKDGKGSISKVSVDGKIISADWITGLNAPKGMGLYKNKLYVADLTEVVVIDVEKAKIVQHIPIERSVFLNDITIDKRGAVYVSDTRANNVYRIEKGFVVTLIQKLQEPNGLLAVGDELLILDKGSLLKMLASGSVTSVTEGMDPNTDGIEPVKPNEYIVSSWSGVLYYIYANGGKQTLLDTRAQKINAADIAYDPKNRMVYVPTLFNNSVVAYELR